MRRFADGAIGDRQRARRNVRSISADNAIKFFVDQLLYRSQFFLQLAALIDQGIDLIIDALQRGHATVRFLKERNGG